MGKDLGSEIDSIDLLLNTMNKPNIRAGVIETIKMIDVIEHNQCYDDCSHPEETVDNTEDDKEVCTRITSSLHTNGATLGSDPETLIQSESENFSPINDLFCCQGGPIDWASCGFQDVHTQEPQEDDEIHCTLPPDEALPRVQHQDTGRPLAQGVEFGTDAGSEDADAPAVEVEIEYCYMTQKYLWLKKR